MPRRATSDENRRRAELLASVLGERKTAGKLSVQEIADESGLGYETVRALLSAKSAGPSFFLVVDLARALKVSLKHLAESSR
jgi:transcriptional regulator with XRE-family HTH domain